MYKLSVCGGLLVLLPCATAYAYIGPGLGAGGLAVVLGILSAVFFAVVGLIWYPAKRMWMALRKSARQSRNGEDHAVHPGDR